ncbi:hypothetical protein SLS61_009348 [Didymella pomorum]
MKRKGLDVSTETGKRQRTAVKEIREADSIYDQAAPYLLATAKFPIDALTSEWNIGANRPIDPAHKRRLRQIFDEAGVLRRDRSHRLQVACSKAQVQQMLDYLAEDGQAQATATAAESAEEGDPKWPSFKGWVSVVGAKVELIAGHHRIGAFKEYLQRRGLPEEERWWVCSIYDKATPQYWFSALNEVMKITSEIQGQHGLDVQLADWNKLAGLPRVRSVHDVRGLFYPSLEPDVEPHPSDLRRRDFFLNISDDVYFNFFQSVLSEPARQFIDIQALLKTTKQEGKLMSIVMSHVGHWMNKEPEKVSDRDNNKPALRKDLVSALQARYSEKADEESCVLQQGVLNHVRENAKEFTSTTLEHYLHEYPSGDDDAYGARFKHKAWRNVLSIVTSFAGPTLQHKYIASLIPEETRKISPPSIAQSVRDLICQIPEVADDPALQSTTAAERLLKMMQPVIAQWISEQRMDVPDRHSEDGQPSTVHPADEQCAESIGRSAEAYAPPLAFGRVRHARIRQGANRRPIPKARVDSGVGRRGISADRGAGPRAD